MAGSPAAPGDTHRPTGMEATNARRGSVLRSRNVNSLQTVAGRKKDQDFGALPPQTGHCWQFTARTGMTASDDRLAGIHSAALEHESVVDPST